jgi:hypothetical protein
MEFEELWNRLPKELRDRVEACEQDPIWHPEGHTGVHIRLVFEAVKEMFPGDTDMLLCAIFHDLGKPETQRIYKRENGTRKISNIGHEFKCLYYLDNYLKLFDDLEPNREKILEVCSNHMRAHQYLSGQLAKPAKREAFEKLKYFDYIVGFAKCDDIGKK